MMDAANETDKTIPVKSILFFIINVWEDTEPLIIYNEIETAKIDKNPYTVY